MATIMAWGDSEGIKGRCDSKCHEAKEPRCECMCGGRFHGAANRPGGLEKAIEDFWEEAIEEAKERAHRDGYELRYGAQLSLFDLMDSSSGKDQDSKGEAKYLARVQ